jgi:hypothetical protein
MCVYTVNINTLNINKKGNIIIPIAQKREVAQGNEN